MPITPTENDEARDRRRDRLNPIHQNVIEAFVARARRIEAHSLFDDPEQLMAITSGSWTFELDAAGGVTSLRATVPLEEQLESLAARVRPVLLQGERVQLTRVLKSLGYFAREYEHPDVSKSVERIRTEFIEITTSHGLGGFHVQVQANPNAPVQDLTDLELAESWLYGDVVHADVGQREAVKDFGMAERFAAASVIYTRAAIDARAALQLVRVLHARSVPIAKDTVFEEDVVANVEDGFVNLMAPGSTATLSLAREGTPEPLLNEFFGGAGPTSGA